VVFVVKAILTRFWERNHGALKIVEITLKAIQSVVKNTILCRFLLHQEKEQEK